jgi:3-oxoacyl-[acyl-carrier protein] reductase
MEGATRYECNLSRKTEIECFVDSVTESATKVDLLVLNTGQMHIQQFENVEPELIPRVIDSSVASLFFIIKKVLPLFISNKNGAIVFLSTSLLYNTLGKHLSLHAATQGAMSGMMKALGKETGRYGITVNMLVSDVAHVHDELPGAVVSRERTLRKRVEPARAVAGTIAWIDHPDCMIHGQVIPVDCGITDHID